MAALLGQEGREGGGGGYGGKYPPPPPIFTLIFPHMVLSVPYMYIK